MFRFLKNACFVLVYLVVIAALIYLCLLGASHVYISGSGFNSFGESLVSCPLWDAYRYLESFDVPGLSGYGPIWVERLEAVHALRNALFLMSGAAIAALLPVACFLLGIFYALQGLFTANWGNFLGGALAATIGIPISAFVAVLMILLAWMMMLFQPCTPMYALICVVVGLPFIALGAFGGATPSVVVIVFVKG